MDAQQSLARAYKEVALTPYQADQAGKRKDEPEDQQGGRDCTAESLC